MFGSMEKKLYLCNVNKKQYYFNILKVIELWQKTLQNLT